ncbi:glycosyl hydrolase family 8 [Rhodovulum adriaticum]|uniref:cellulase n=1 Tax=Rhodovulum adriaticum TaxID=35804 RepID=A0A4R2NLU7_RHOAD|nr:glycosyl hydrolase family 8 [Rhodovulum adriaticum]MBK1636001.1 hypothetical protein [Rhodovulum adriaticum]TCP22432.1 endoglucanase [Rhodovulum adriaticum]
MNRREALHGMAALAGGLFAGQSVAHASTPALMPAWRAWAQQYIEYSGRVVDTLQLGASHSESQGYGLLLAASMGDRVRFDAIDGWTQRNLAIRDDALLAWRWLPNQRVHVPDINNASDGDLFYAWALLRASRRFDDGALAHRAARIVEDLVGTCCAERPDRPGQLLLLPAEKGFSGPGRVVFNASYVMPLAMRELAAATGNARLAQAATDSLSLMAEIARNGPVPDWVDVSTRGVTPPREFEHKVGYEALRVPLFLIWSSLADHPAARQARALHAGTDGRGTVFAAAGGARLQSSHDPGYRAISALLECSGTADWGAAIPPFSTSQPYYPATLHLFAMLAQMEALPRCVPL